MLYRLLNKEKQLWNNPCTSRSFEVVWIKMFPELLLQASFSAVLSVQIKKKKSLTLEAWICQDPLVSTYYPAISVTLRGKNLWSDSFPNKETSRILWSAQDNQTVYARSWQIWSKCICEDPWKNQILLEQWQEIWSGYPWTSQMCLKTFF